MKKFLATTLSVVAVVAVVVGIPGQSLALLISGQDIIAAPEFVLDDPPGAVNDHQQAFNERRGVELLADLQVDGGIIAAGTYVDSHMIFLNTQDSSITSDIDVDWTFDGEILGVMSDRSGLLEAASNGILGAVGTVYPGSFPARGMEGGSGQFADSYIMLNNIITVNMHVSEPGDWIRVVTRSTVPEPGTVLLLGAGLIGLVGLRRTLKK